MKLHIDFDIEDFITFNIYHIFHSKGGRRTILFGRASILIIAIIAVLIFVVMQANRGMILVEAIIFLAIGIIWFISYPVVMKRSIRKRILKMRDQGNFPYAPEADVEFAEDEVIETTPESERRSPYADFREIAETDDYIYIAKVTAESMVIPLRCVEDKDALLKLLHEKIG